MPIEIPDTFRCGKLDKVKQKKVTCIAKYQQIEEQDKYKGLKGCLSFSLISL